MSLLLFQHVFTFATLLPFSLYHVASSVRSHLLSPRHSARPHYPLPLHPHQHAPHLLLHLPLTLSIPALLLSTLLPLPPLHRSPPLLLLSSLQSSLSLLPFLLLSISLLLHPSLPSPLPFLLSSLSFALLSFSSHHHPFPSDTLPLHAKLSSTSSLVSLSSALLSLSLALNPRLFPAELALAATLSLAALWSIQTGLSLHTDAFLPEGCHRVLDVPAEIAARCELDDSRRRAAAVLDLMLVVYAVLIAVAVGAVYAVVARVVGGGVRRVGSYEALPTSASVGALSDASEGVAGSVQMKALGRSAALD